MSAPDEARPAASARPPRRTLLIDPRFQLKYTALLVAVVFAVMASLGMVIWQTADAAASNARLAAAQAERATRQALESSNIVRMNALTSAESPEAAQTIEREFAVADRAAERDVARARAQGQESDRQLKRMVRMLLAGGVVLLGLLTVLGVFITQRITGPVFKLKRLLRRVGTGRLVVKERLRRGDELGDLFETFLQMTHSLHALQRGRLATLEATLRKAEASGASPEVLAGLRALRAQLRHGLPTASLPARPSEDAAASRAAAGGSK